AAVALAALLLRGTPGPVSTAPAAPAAPASTPPPPRSSGFPAPPPGAVVYSREDGPYALALGVVPNGGRVLAQVSVVGQQGTGVNGLRVSVGSVAATACGSGCYQVTPPRPRAI